MTLELALELARIGWHVFPCGADKKPLCKWKQAATNDPDAIKVMNWPDLVGVYCQKSGFFAIDLDRKNGADGVRTWQKWLDSRERPEAGPIQKTPKGGLHILFKNPQNITIPNKAGFFPGIDLRSEGYICTGEGYEWLNPPETPIPNAPGWFLDFFDNGLLEYQSNKAQPISTMKAGQYWLDYYLKQARNGNRNETGLKLALQLRDSGLSEVEAQAIPYPEKTPQGNEPYTRAEWEATVKSAYNRPARDSNYQPGAPGMFETARGLGEVTESNQTITQEQEHPRYIIRTAADALKPQPPLEWVIDGIISRGSVNLFYGEPGAKKTYSLLSLAVCVACGKPWLDFPVKPGKVLIIDEESGEKRLSIRIAAALRGELATENTPLEYVSLAQFKLDDKNDPKILQALIEETGAALVIIDALADIMTGDENSKQDTQPVLTALRKIAEETGAAILIIHHANKVGGYRGSSAIKAAVDLMTLIASEDGSDYVNFKSEKNRDGEAVNWAARATWTDNQFYLSAAPKPERVKALCKSQEYVIRYLTEHGASPIPAIMAGADTCSPEAARKAVYNLADLKRIHRTNPGETGQGVSAIYDLTAEGEK